MTDDAGNPLAGDVGLSFETADSSLLGGIAGRLHGAENGPSGTFFLKAALVADPNVGSATTLSRPGAFSLPGLPPGRYQVSAFLDTNGDGVWTPGQPAPFVPSEPYSNPTEPVTVRSRWTTDGVEIRIETVRYIKENAERRTRNDE